MGDIVELKFDKNKERAYIEERVRLVLDSHFSEEAKVCGFAFMVWDKSGQSTCDSQNMEGNIPSVLIPDFVRNRLLADRVEVWSLDAIRDDK